MANKAKKNNERKFKKNYIGKGTQVEGMDIVKVSIAVDEIEQYQHEYKGKKYLTFEVAKMRDKDEYGKSHTAYVSTEVKDEK